MHLNKFSLLSSKIGCILNSQLLQHLPSEISDKQIVSTFTICVHQSYKTLADFWLKYSKNERWMFLLGESVWWRRRWRQLLTNAVEVVGIAHEADVTLRALGSVVSRAPRAATRAVPTHYSHRMRHSQSHYALTDSIGADFRFEVPGQSSVGQS